MSDKMTEIIDIHAHILPGIDDGARDVQEVKAMLYEAYHQGVRGIIATPHYHYRHYQTNSDTIKILVEKVRKIAEEISGDLKIYSGQEIFYVHGMIEKLKKKELLTLAGTRYVLVEFPVKITYERLYQTVRKMVGEGYIPVLAHVERYGCLRKRGTVEELMESGAYMQINYGSLAGFRDLGTRMWCRKMVLENNIHFLGSDMHRMDYRPPEMKKGLDWLMKIQGGLMVEQLIWENPSRLLENKFLD